MKPRNAEKLSDLAQVAQLHQSKVSLGLRDALNTDTEQSQGWS